MRVIIGGASLGQRVGCVVVVYPIYANWERIGLSGRRVSHSTSFRAPLTVLNVKGNGAGGVGSVGFSAHAEERLLEHWETNVPICYKFETDPINDAMAVAISEKRRRRRA